MISNATPWMYEHTLYNGVATQSLRFAYTSAETWLARTPNAGNRKTHTLSVWVKRSGLSASQNILEAKGSGDTGNVDIWFDANDRLEVSGSSTYWRTTTRRFRDVSSWYHIMIVTDTTDGTAADRLKIYVNGTRETSFVDNNHYSQNTDYAIGGNVEHRIGDGYGHFDGYMARYEFVDGIALDASYFGETKNGVWIPKKYTGSYGTNGHLLEFKQTGTNADSSGLGADTSGNDNHYTPTEITAVDSAMLDSPENNFCTLNPIDNLTGATLSEGNLKSASTSNSWKNVRSTFVMPTGSWYVELLSLVGIGNGNIGIGIVPQSNASPGNAIFASVSNSWQYLSNGNWYNNNGVGGSGATFSVTSSSRDIVGMSFDGSEVKFYKNNSLIHTISSIPTNDYAIGISLYDTDEQCILNFGQDSSFAGNKTAQGNTDANGIGDFYYEPPSGFLALCSANLPEPTIGGISSTLPTNHFNTVLWTGNASSRSITGVGFQPDWVWFKPRSDADNHVLIDSSRGGTKYLMSNRADAELTQDPGITAFGTDGFSIGNWTNINENSQTYVAWNWKANGGTTSSNTDGSITSTVQANTDAGFSIVTYTGTGANATVGHGLGATPDMVIYKIRDAGVSWAVWHKDLATPTTGLLELNSTGVELNSASYWNSTIPTSTVLSIGTYGGVNASSPFIAYCFANVEGYSKIGKYNPNNTTDNAFVHTGFKPAMVILKGAEISNQEWGILDNKRPGYNSVYFLQPQSNATETTSNIVDFLSNGFKIRATGGVGYLTSNYIYMAFAEAPFKYANAG